MSTIAIIPARGGSRRIPHKNRRMFHVKPIIAYSIEAAKESGLFDDIFVSTEDYEIGSIALSYGARLLLRDKKMSDDNTGTQEVMADALRRLINEALKIEPWAFTYREIDYACCIYATAPMMTADDLLRARDWLDYSHGEGYAYIPGWFYFARTRTFLDEVPIEQSVPMTAPKNCYIDINTPDDWIRAEEMYAALHKERA